MKNHQRAGRVILCLAIIITIAALAVAGCTESANEHQGQMTAPGEKQSENSAVKSIAVIRTTSTPTQPALDPALPGAVITFNPVGEKNVGDSVLITGTTSLPAATDLFWQVRQDTGTPPTSIDMSSRIGIMANNQVTKGDGTSNHVALTVEPKDTKDLVAGKYVALVVSLKGDPMTVDPTTGTLAGYTYLTLK
ncbi:MAG: hypothetical protein WC379_14165 [Methanoregula sp.]|jgi:hypothetical protein